MKTETSVFTVRLPLSLQTELDGLAENTDRSRSWLVARAIEDYVRVQKWQIEQIREGLEAAKRGEFATEEEMEALFNKYDPQ